MVLPRPMEVPSHGWFSNFNREPSQPHEHSCNPNLMQVWSDATAAADSIQWMLAIPTVR